MSDKVHLFVDASKETDYALEGNFGIEYFPIKNLSVSGQLTSYSHKSSFAVAYRWKSLHIELCNTLHNTLNNSSCISLTYSL